MFSVFSGFCRFFWIHPLLRQHPFLNTWLSNINNIFERLLVYLGGIQSMNSLLVNPENWFIPIYIWYGSSGPMYGNKPDIIMGYKLLWALAAAFDASKNTTICSGSVKACFGNSIRDNPICGIPMVLATSVNTGWSLSKRQGLFHQTGYELPGFIVSQWDPKDPNYFEGYRSGGSRKRKF